MNTKFEELNSELENVMGGLFSVDPQSNDITSCKNSCTTKCDDTAYGTINGVVTGVITSTPAKPDTSNNSGE